MQWCTKWPLYQCANTHNVHVQCSFTNKDAIKHSEPLISLDAVCFHAQESFRRGFSEREEALPISSDFVDWVILLNETYFFVLYHW